MSSYHNLDMGLLGGLANWVTAQPNTIQGQVSKFETDTFFLENTFIKPLKMNTK